MYSTNIHHPNLSIFRKNLYEIIGKNTAITERIY